VACRAWLAALSRTELAGPILPKSPRSALSAMRSVSISLAVRYPSRRKAGTGGHHPWVACCNRKPPTSAGSISQRLCTVAASTVPARATDAAFASNTRSMSHSSSSSPSRRSMPDWVRREEMNTTIGLALNAMVDFVGGIERYALDGIRKHCAPRLRGSAGLALFRRPVGGVFCLTFARSPCSSTFETFFEGFADRGSLSICSSRCSSPLGSLSLRPSSWLGAFFDSESLVSGMGKAAHWGGRLFVGITSTAEPRNACGSELPNPGHRMSHH
jgi:hypothetical protein